jgi:hypothetical protein
LKFEKAPPILKRTPSHFLWAVLSFSEHDKENRESAEIVWPMATSTSLLPTHPKRTLALGYLGYRKFLALSVFSLSINVSIQRLSRRLSQTLESVTCDSRTPQCQSRRPLETCESDVQINTRPVSHVPTTLVDRKYRFPYMASCRLPYMGIL